MAVNNLPRVPEGLRDLMKIYTKEVLREKPPNLYEFSAIYFERIATRSTQQKAIKYEPPQSYEIIMKNRMRQQVPLSMVYNIIPDSLTELIKKFIKAVLKENPQNLLLFAKEYFQNLRDSHAAKVEYAKYAAYEKLMHEKESVSSAKRVKCECGRILDSKEEESKTKISSVSTESAPKQSESVEIHQSAQYLKAVYIIQKHCRKYLKRKHEKSAKMTTEKKQIYHSQDYINAIFVIQRQIRLYLKRKHARSAALKRTESAKLYDSAKYINAVHVIQRFCRQHLKRKALQKQALSKTETTISQEHNVSLMTAAFIIQRAFRRYVRARKSRKHINAELDQNDDINDNASEAASYTSASTALLSTESACEHLDFGGNNYEEGVHQQTIKEDEEVENDNTNLQMDYVTETIKSTGKSINYLENDIDTDSKETLLSKLEGDKLDGFFEQVNKMDVDNKLESGKTLDDDFPIKTVVKRQVSNENIETKVNTNDNDNKSDDKESFQKNVAEIKVIDSASGSQEELKSTVSDNKPLVNEEIRVKEEQIKPVNISIDNTEAKHSKPEQEKTLKSLEVINNIDQECNKEVPVEETHLDNDKNMVIHKADQSNSVEDIKLEKTTSAENLQLNNSENVPASEPAALENNSDSAIIQKNMDATLEADELWNNKKENSKETATANTQPEKMYSVEVNSLQEVLKNIQVKDVKDKLEKDNTEVNTTTATAESEILENEIDSSLSQDFVNSNNKTKSEDKDNSETTHSEVKDPSQDSLISEIGNSIKIQSILPGEDDYEIMLAPQIVINSGSSSLTTDTTEIANDAMDEQNKSSDQNVDNTEIKKSTDAEESPIISRQISLDMPENESVEEVIIKEITGESKLGSPTNTSENLNNKQVEDNQNTDLNVTKHISLEDDKNQKDQKDSETTFKNQETVSVKDNVLVENENNSGEEDIPPLSADSAKNRTESLEKHHSAQYLKAVCIIQKHCRKYLKRKLDRSNEVTTEKISEKVIGKNSADKSLEDTNPVKIYSDNENKNNVDQTNLTTEQGQVKDSFEQANNENVDVSDEQNIIADISGTKNIDNIKEHEAISLEDSLTDQNQKQSLSKENSRSELNDNKTSASSTKPEEQNTKDNENVQENISTSSVSNLPVLKQKSLADLEETQKLEPKTEIASNAAKGQTELELIKIDQPDQNLSDKIGRDDQALLNQKSEIAADEKEIDKTILPANQANKNEANIDIEIEKKITTQISQELETETTKQKDNDEENREINKDDSSEKPTESNQSLPEDKMVDSSANSTSEINKKITPDSPSRDNKSSLLLSNQLIGTQIITPTKSRKMTNTKEKHSTTPTSSRLMNTPVAELQLKSFKTGSDSGAWYEIQSDLNESLLDTNDCNSNQGAHIFTHTGIKNLQSPERSPKYLNGEQLETKEPRKQKQAIAYFISFDGNEGKTSYKIPKKFLRQSGSSLNKKKLSKKTKEENPNSLGPKLNLANEVEFDEVAIDQNYSQFGAQKLQTIHEINENESSNDIKGDLDRSEEVNRASKEKEDQAEKVQIVISDANEFEQNLTESNEVENESYHTPEDKKQVEKDSNSSNDSNRLRSAQIIQRAYKNYMNRKNIITDKNVGQHETIKDLPNESETQNLAAIKIQRIFRQFLEKVARKKPETESFSSKKYTGNELLAVLRIQSTFRNYIRRKKQTNCEDISEATSANSLLTAIPKNSSLTHSETSYSRGLISPTSDDLTLDSDTELNSTKTEWFVGTQRILVESSGTPVIETIETNTFAPISESTNNTQSNGSHESKLATDIGSSLSDLSSQQVYEYDNGDSDNLAGSASEVVKDLVQDLTDTAFAKLDASREDDANTRQLLNDFLNHEVEFSSKQGSSSGKSEEGVTQKPDEVQEDECIKKTVSLNYPHQDEAEDDIESKVTKEEDDNIETKKNSIENKEEHELKEIGGVETTKNGTDKDKKFNKDNQAENESIGREVKVDNVAKVSDEKKEENIEKVSDEEKINIFEEEKLAAPVTVSGVTQKIESKEQIEMESEKENENKEENEKGVNKDRDTEREKKDKEAIEPEKEVRENDKGSKEENVTKKEVNDNEIVLKQENVTGKERNDNEKGLKEENVSGKEVKENEKELKENDQIFKEENVTGKEEKENQKELKEEKEQKIKEENKVEKDNLNVEDNEQRNIKQNQVEVAVVNDKDNLLIKEINTETNNMLEKENINQINEDKDEDSLAAVDAIDEATLKLSGPDEVIEKMSQRQLSETREKHKDDYNITEPVFDEPVIRPMSSLQDQSSLDIEDGDIIVYNRLQREATRESSAQSESVIFGEDVDDDRFLSNDADIARIQLSRHYTIAGEDPHSIFRTVTIDDTVQYIEDRYGDEIAAMDSTSSFCLDDETSENIRKKIMAYSLSETDSDYFDPNKAINDDSHVDTAMTDIMDTSTETESTIVSAATKIQAGARGFITRRRLRRASAGTKSSTQETKASFGNDAISESLERFIEEEAAKKIQSAYRLHSKKQKKQEKNIKSGRLEGSLTAKRMTLQRGDALRNDSNSTPEDEHSNSSKSGQKLTQSKLCKEKLSKSKSEYAVMWPGIRQNSMPVQIESEVLRIIPKHIRKRIKSAENGKKKYGK